MAGKADFSDAEWENLQLGLTGAGMLVAVSDAGFFDSFKEAGSLAKHLGEASRTSSSELIRDIARTHGTGFGLTAKPEEVEAKTLAALESAVATLAVKAPDDLASTFPQKPGPPEQESGATAVAEATPVKVPKVADPDADAASKN